MNIPLTESPTARSIGSSTTIWLAVAFLAVSVAVVAAEQPRVEQERQVARVDMTSGSIAFEPLVANAGTVLIVNGPRGRVFEKEFEAGQDPLYGLTDANGAPLADGTYTYELRIISSPATAEGIRGEAISRPRLTRSGSFTIQGGSLAVEQSASQDPDPSTDPSPLDVTHADDVIVEGNLCSSDADQCADGEGFVAGPHGTGNELKAKDNFPSIWLDDTDPGDSDYFIDEQGGNFHIHSGSAGSSTAATFQILSGSPDNSLVLAANGDAGVGTATPADPLHVFRTDGRARLLVDEDSGTVATRTLLRLDNNGNVRFRMRDTSGSGNAFDFQQVGNNFLINFVDATPGGEFQVNENGAVRMGADGAESFLLGPAGNLEIAGTLTENSTRAVKADLLPVDGGAILEKLIQLPVSEWRYEFDPPSVRHLGPMAEDFHAAFGLGPDDEHIAPKDLAGVSLAAIQGLYERLEEKDERLAAQDARIERLESELAELRQLVERLASRR